MEVTSFVHPVYVPQMKDAKEVLEGIVQSPDIQYMALVPNEKGFDKAIEQGVRAVSLVVGASNSFNLENVKMTREESIQKLESVIIKAKAADIFIRYNIATAFWCPFEGRTDSNLVLEMVKRIDSLGVDEIVICDTIGRENPKQVYSLFKGMMKMEPDAMITAHFHDTYGLAQANIIAALQAEVIRFDASMGGLGGCPFAPGAAGNVATEDVVFLMKELGIQTGIDLESLKSCLGLIREIPLGLGARCAPSTYGARPRLDHRACENKPHPRHILAVDSLWRFGARRRTPGGDRPTAIRLTRPPGRWCFGRPSG